MNAAPPGGATATTIAEHIDAGFVASSLLLLRAGHAGALLLVEDGDDQRFFERLTTPECRVTLGYQRAFVLEALTLIESRVSGVVAVLDARWERLEQRPPPSPAMLYTDTHDLELLLLASPALDKLLSVLGTRDKLRQAAGPDSWLERLLQALRPLGALRWLLQRQGLDPLPLSQIPLAALLQSGALAIDAQLLLSEVSAHYPEAALGPERLLAALQALPITEPDLTQLCAGSDVLRLLGHALCSLLGDQEPSAVTPARLFDALLLAYEDRCFRATTLFRDLCAWERQHQLEVLGQPEFHVPGFVLERELGAGAAGRVFRAREDSTLAARRAVKILDPHPLCMSPHHQARFEREAEALSRLEHAAIVRYISSGYTRDERRPFLVMELIDGENLRSAASTLSLEQRLQVMAQVLSGLCHAHERQVFHRDLKPANIVLRAADRRPVLVDFGLACLWDIGVAADLTGSVIGTPGYIPPEVQADPRSSRGPKHDVYAFGVTLYQVLVGARPVAGQYVPLASAIPGLQQAHALDLVIRAAIEPSESLRTPTCAALREQLTACL